jgi:hypothetical protein
MKIEEVKQLLKEQLPHYELVVKDKTKATVAAGGFRVRLVGSTREMIARVKNGKVEIVTG